MATNRVGDITIFIFDKKKRKFEGQSKSMRGKLAKWRIIKGLSDYQVSDKRVIR